jgi:uncharacterized membrane protein
MERQRVATALLIVTSLGAILSILGIFMAAGIDPVGTLYSTFTLIFTIFSLLFIVSLVFYQQSLNTTQNQYQVEQDSILG